MGIYGELAELDKQRPRKRSAPVLHPAGGMPTASTKAVLPSPQDVHTPVATEVTPDVGASVKTDAVTSLLHDVDRRKWRDTIENTETHSSALRMTVEERERVEDLIRDLRRTHGIKVSMNELARLGLLLLAHDFRKHGELSIVHKIKKS